MSVRKLRCRLGLMTTFEEAVKHETRSDPEMEFQLKTQLHDVALELDAVPMPDYGHPEQCE